ncbi:transposase [Candidatus Parcubacteria bacterium]|nr:transposase [Candidatus Parcubacteria bacterium]
MPQPLPEKRKIVWSDDKYYFLTNSTYLHYPYFKQPDQKQIVLNSIKKLQSKYSIPVQDFSIAINHSHLMFYADKGKKVSLVKRFLKNNVSREYRESYQVPYSEMWHSTRVFWVKDDKMFWGVRGYITGNLLKHKEVSGFQELYDNPFSSFKYTADKFGFDTLRELVKSVIEVKEDSYGDVDVEGMEELELKPLSREGRILTSTLS